MEKDFTKPYNKEEKEISQTDKLKRAYRIGRDVVIGTALVGLMGWSLNRTLDNYSPLSEKDYQNAKWYSSSATPNQAYLFEKIPHNQLTMNLFYQQVKAKNGGSLKNATLYPDLDKNGGVAE